MNGAEATLTVITSVLGVVIIPLLVIAFRATLRWKGIEDKLAEVVTDVRDLVEHKDKVHQELYNQMRRDREGTDRRLRWLEENIWNPRRGR